ncbi:uncharacterized protein PpBr36_11166 [Pyricularia pennisetigena]|uniref:uncharacterized protein n=1 Tax=Pyricularia pennisetigena TaxID=1578925 RepID=UPI00114FCA50|nr:uncharacterized protein PpBr36_11166 [Pyricularia pennisetigena]TLS20521.1 hypothetical protein PpBr36_11166 [Pyricularia pennisetigena]
MSVRRISAPRNRRHFDPLPTEEKMVRPTYMTWPSTYYGPKRYRRRGCIPRHKLIVILVLKPFPSHIGEPFSLRLVGDNTGWMSLHESKSVGLRPKYHLHLNRCQPDPGFDMIEAIEDSIIQFGNQVNKTQK